MNPQRLSAIFTSRLAVGILAALAGYIFYFTGSELFSLVASWNSGSPSSQRKVWLDGPHGVYVPGTLTNADPLLDVDGKRPKIADFYASQKIRTLVLLVLYVFALNYLAAIGLRFFALCNFGGEGERLWGIIPWCGYLISFLVGAFLWVGALRFTSFFLPLLPSIWLVFFLGLFLLCRRPMAISQPLRTTLRWSDVLVANLLMAGFFIFNLQSQWFPCGGDSTAWWIPQFVGITEQPAGWLPKLGEAYFEHFLALPFYLIESVFLSNPLFLMPYAWVNGCVKAAGFAGLFGLARRMGFGWGAALLAGGVPFFATLRLDAWSHTYLFGSSNPLALNLHAQIILAILLPIWAAGLVLIDASHVRQRGQNPPPFYVILFCFLTGVGISSISPNGPLFLLVILAARLFLREKNCPKDPWPLTWGVRIAFVFIFLASFLLAAYWAPAFSWIQALVLLGGGLLLLGALVFETKKVYRLTFWREHRDAGVSKTLALGLGILVGLAWLGNVTSLFLQSGRPALHRGLVESHASRSWETSMLWEPICARSETGQIMEGQLPLFLNYGLPAFLLGAAFLACLSLPQGSVSGDKTRNRYYPLLAGIMAAYLLMAYFHYFRIFSTWIGGMGVRNRFFEVPFYAGIFFGIFVLAQYLPRVPRKVFQLGLLIYVGLPFLWNLLPEGNWILKQWLVNAGFLGRLLGIFQG